jgi:hypothetical protein
MVIRMEKSPRPVFSERIKLAIMMLLETMRGARRVKGRKSFRYTFIFDIITSPEPLIVR